MMILYFLHSCNFFNKRFKLFIIVHVVDNMIITPNL